MELKDFNVLPLICFFFNSWHAASLISKCIKFFRSSQHSVYNCCLSTKLCSSFYDGTFLPDPTWLLTIHPLSLSHIVAPLDKPTPTFPHIRLVFQFLFFYDNSHYANMLLLTSIKTQSLPNSNVHINHTEAWVKCWFWLIWARMARSKNMHFLQVPTSCWFFWSWTTLWLKYLYIFLVYFLSQLWTP